MYWHIDTDIVSLIVIAALYAQHRKRPEQGGALLRDRRFLRCLEAGVVVTAVDIAASIVMEAAVPRAVYHLFMTAYFVLIEYVILAWFLYVLTILYQADERRGRAVGRAARAVYLLYALFAAANPWTGLIYSLGADGVYARGPFFALMLLLYAAYTLVLLVLILVRWRHIPAGYPGGVLLLTPLVIGAGIAAQLAVPGWLLIMPSYMICLLLADLFLQQMRERSSRAREETLERAAETDPLTGLFNRVGMEQMVQRTLAESFGQRAAVLIADIDDLKLINDSMGHAEGDRAICAAATQLKKHFRAYDTVVRYGGDEFLAFYVGALTEEQIMRSMTQLCAELSALRVGPENEVPLRCSVGVSFGTVGTDHFEALCAQADAALYQVKRNGKNGFALYRPGMEQEWLRAADPASGGAGRQA